MNNLFIPEGKQRVTSTILQKNLSCPTHTVIYCLCLFYYSTSLFEHATKLQFNV